MLTTKHLLTASAAFAACGMMAANVQAAPVGVGFKATDFTVNNGWGVVDATTAFPTLTNGPLLHNDVIVRDDSVGGGADTLYYTITFPQAGDYALYARGSSLAGGNQDLAIADGFGHPDTTSTGWFSKVSPRYPLNGNGPGNGFSWDARDFSWRENDLSLSSWEKANKGLGTYTVPVGQLTQTFYIRERGPGDNPTIDAWAFVLETDPDNDGNFKEHRLSNEITLNELVIPEPAAAALVGVGGLLMLRRRSRG